MVKRSRSKLVHPSPGGKLQHCFRRKPCARIMAVCSGKRGNLSSCRKFGSFLRYSGISRRPAQYERKCKLRFSSLGSKAVIAGQRSHVCCGSVRDSSEASICRSRTLGGRARTSFEKTLTLGPGALLLV